MTKINDDFFKLEADRIKSARPTAVNLAWGVDQALAAILAVRDPARKTMAAWDNQVPFYVALPSSTFDWNITDGVNDIPIEQRDPDEITYVCGLDRDRPAKVLICPPSSPAANFAFDVTPAKYVTGLITERGVCKATEADIRKLFPAAAR